ncbi:MAG: hypothetical protein E7395_07395 [Ruminococcaceae bacterium]|nr:hypothetical protein [Oscillospiraceae bacterium]
MAKKGYPVRFIICVYIICCLVRKFDEIGIEIINTLELWAGVLVPSLFPYMVLSQYITSSGMLSILKPIKIIVMKLFSISESGADVYLCSLVSGYPSGAVCVRELYNSGEIDKKEAERLVQFTNNAGALFVISAIGSTMLGCTKDGVAIYIIQNLSAMIFGFISSLFSPKNNPLLCRTTVRSKPLIKCCSDSVDTMLKICGYLICVTVVGSIAIMTLKASPYFNGQYETIAKCGVYMILEITKCVQGLSALEHTPVVFALICGAVSFGGVSVILQIKSCLPDDFETKKLVAARVCQGAISFVLGYAYEFVSEPCVGCKSENIATIASLALCALIFVGSLILKSNRIRNN